MRVLGINLFFGCCALFLELVQTLQVVYLPGDLLVLLYPLFTQPQLALDALGPFGIIPKCRIECLIGQIMNILKSVIDVKDTPLRPPAFALTP
jgi:hypothetical protein